MEKRKVVSLLKLTAKTVITLLALWYVFSRVELHSVLQVMRRAEIVWLLPALLLFILSKTVAAFRLNLFFGSAGVSLPGKYNLKLYLLGMFYNLFLPGGIGGDGYKIWLLNKKHDASAGTIFRAVLTDRLSGVTALFILAVIFYYLIPDYLPYRNLMWLTALAAPATLWLVCRYFFRTFLALFFPTGLLSLAVQLLQLLSAWMILQALHVTEGNNAYLLLFLISSIVAILPVTVGGIGAREFTFMTGAAWMHLDAGQAIALSLLFYLITLFTSFWGILFIIKPSWLEEKKK